MMLFYLEETLLRTQVGLSTRYDYKLKFLLEVQNFEATD